MLAEADLRVVFSGGLAEDIARVTCLIYDALMPCRLHSVYCSMRLLIETLNESCTGQGWSILTIRKIEEKMPKR